MYLLMFDVDGTPIHSNEYDAECFVRAVLTTMGISVVDKDWGSYEHVTDSGILDELVRCTYGRQPTQEEICLVRDRFLIELERKLAKQPGLARPIEGAIPFDDDRPIFWIRDFTDIQKLQGILEDIRKMTWKPF